MTFDWTINLTAVILGVITLLVIPLSKLLGHTLFELRDAVRDLRRAVGTAEPPEGVLGDIGSIKREVRKHRNWIIELFVAANLPWKDRS